jgi:hypothetical protein
VTAIVVVVLSILLIIVTALLSDASPGKARPSLGLSLNATTSIREWQSSERIDNFEGLTLEKLRAREPDLEWVGANQNISKDHPNRVGIDISDDMVIIATRDKQKCYFALFTSKDILSGRKTHWSSVESDTCSASLAPEINQKNWSTSIREVWGPNED